MNLLLQQEQESPVDDDFRMTAELESRALNDQADDGLDTISVDFDTVLGLVGEEQAKKMFEQSAPMKQKSLKMMYILLSRKAVSIFYLNTLCKELLRLIFDNTLYFFILY